MWITWRQLNVTNSLSGEKQKSTSSDGNNKKSFWLQLISYTTVAGEVLTVCLTIVINSIPLITWMLIAG